MSLRSLSLWHCSVHDYDVIMTSHYAHLASCRHSKPVYAVVSFAPGGCAPPRPRTLPWIRTRCPAINTPAVWGAVHG